jgi:hypothetical protein
MNEDAQLNQAPPGISCEGIAPTNSPPRRSFHSSLGISCEGIAPINSPPQGATAPLGTSCEGIAPINSHPRGAQAPPGTSWEGIAPNNSHPGGASPVSLGISCEGIAPTNSPPQGSSAGGLCAGVYGIALSPAKGVPGPARGEDGIALTPGTRGSGGVTKQQYQQR